ncbi:hypothetical protein A2943_03070 [Candidatus Adlerbacteria bacterium RIFCSPLOWO2_01_FULL_51_16]|uniref:Methyltransferase domain-containing protein n=1 Tax=Candidatus Adlerbacteria bacterium RIFCSPLOWO2_01_FULL_51_16 TaxID=1797243 RepID=A0A1F4XI12_9BACT|nr:MAG: hypothetical protein A2943_03070 [Candidatus Adlerbacteria bacterium RIFCSPLOWO2_01_FULL_51_16]
MSTATTPTPDYLKKYYWWAYVDPRALRFWDRPWLTNLILCGYYRRLSNEVIEEFEGDLSGCTLQISVPYGNFTPRLAACVTRSGGTLDLIDVVQAQLKNVSCKIAAADAEVARFIQMDSSALIFSPGVYDRAILYFLLHEQPQDVREKTVAEALRVLKPGGTLVVLDYGKPSLWHPLRYLLLPLLGTIEPFAVALWNRELWELLPSQFSMQRCRKTSYFGGLYQKIVYVKP